MLELYSHSTKSKRGMIKLNLQIECKREGLSLEAVLEEHKILMRAIVDYESKTVRKVGRGERGEGGEGEEGKKKKRGRGEKVRE